MRKLEFKKNITRAYEAHGYVSIRDGGETYKENCLFEISKEAEKNWRLRIHAELAYRVEGREDFHSFSHEERCYSLTKAKARAEEIRKLGFISQPPKDEFEGKTWSVSDVAISDKVKILGLTDRQKKILWEKAGISK